MLVLGVFARMKHWQVIYGKFKGECLAHEAGCGQVGHRLESCSCKAAVEIRRLRWKLEKTRHKVGARNNPGRQNRKSGYTKEKENLLWKTKQGQQIDMVWISRRPPERHGKSHVGICSNMASCIDRLDVWLQPWMIRQEKKEAKTERDAAARESGCPHSAPPQTKWQRCMGSLMHTIQWMCVEVDMNVITPTPPQPPTPTQNEKHVRILYHIIYFIAGFYMRAWF